MRNTYSLRKSYRIPKSNIKTIISNYFIRKVIYIFATDASILAEEILFLIFMIILKIIWTINFNFLLEIFWSWRQNL